MPDSAEPLGWPPGSSGRWRYRVWNAGGDVVFEILFDAASESDALFRGAVALTDYLKRTGARVGSIRDAAERIE